jgi:L-lactate utilization protein LutC
MTFLKRLLGIKDKSSENEDHEKSKYMPKEKPPSDELFMNNFINNGGKFIYCENKNELYQNFILILKEQNWEGQKVYSHDIERDKRFLEDLDIAFSNNKDENILIADCEFLIAADGSILVCSNQVGEGKLSDLPHNFIIYAKTSQIIDTISESLQQIKKKYSNIPTSITSLKTFKENDEVDFLSYGSTQKNLYLLLLEDL